MLLLLHATMFCYMDASLFTTLFGTSIPTSFNILNKKYFTLCISMLFMHVNERESL